MQVPTFGKYILRLNPLQYLLAFILEAPITSGIFWSKDILLDLNTIPFPFVILSNETNYTTLWILGKTSNDLWWNLPCNCEFACICGTWDIWDLLQTIFFPDADLALFDFANQLILKCIWMVCFFFFNFPLFIFGFHFNLLHPENSFKSVTSSSSLLAVCSLASFLETFVFCIINWILFKKVTHF